MTSPLEVIARAAELPPDSAPHPVHEERARRRRTPTGGEDDLDAFDRGDHVEVSGRYAATLSHGIHDEGATYEYDETRGVFVALAPSDEARRVMSFAGAWVDNKRLKMNASDVDGIIKLAAARMARPGFFAEAPAGLAFADAFVSVELDGRIARAPHSPEHRARHAYPFAFDGPAEPRRFLAMLHACFRDDADADAKVALVQEYAGACLFGIATRYQRAMLLFGPGGDGKSQVIEVIKAAMPACSVRAIAPQELGDKFARVHLVGALLNAVGDVPSGPILDSGYLKAAISGDEIEAQEKHRPQVKFRPRAGHVFSTNRLMPVSDTSPGFWRRWLVLPFSRSFEGPNARPEDATARVRDIGAVIARKELPELARWFVHGATRLVTRGAYDVPPSSDAALAEWRGEASSVALFLGDATAPARHASERTRASHLYANYKSWCETNGHRLPMTSTAFGRALRDLAIVNQKSGGVMYYPLVLLNGVDSAGRAVPLGAVS